MSSDTRNTLSKNKSLILDILRLRKDGIAGYKIPRKIGRKIKKSTVYSIINEHKDLDSSIAKLEMEIENENI